MLSRALILALLASLALAQTGQNQQPAQPSATPAPAQPPIKVQVNEVIVPVTVTDDRGRFVSNLDATDFRILDEGQEQKIEYFSRERSQPVVIGFLIDMSNATRIHWKNFQDAAIEMTLNMLPGDKKYSGYLIAYGNEAELLVNTTTDSEPIVEKLRKMKPGGGSALFDAIYMACTKRHLVEGEPFDPRRVLIIVGDGHDTASKKTLDEALEIAQRNLVTIYAMSTVSFGFNSEGSDDLTRLAEETGGRVMYPLNNLYKDVSGLPLHAVRRRQLRLQSRDGRLRVGSGFGDFPRGRGHRRRGHHPVHHPLYSRRWMTASVTRRCSTTSRSPSRICPTVRIRARKGYYPVNP